MGLAVSAVGATPAATPVDFARQIRPILADNCFTCHGPDEAARKANLRLDVREAAIKPAKSGAIAIVAGDAAKSEMHKRITATDADDLMPPTKTGKKLSAAQVELLKRWIGEGAKYEAHWAFVPPKRPALPVVKDGRWARNGIDAFVLGRLESEGMKPSAEADRATWLRRVTLDLTGLPPTISELDAFLADKSLRAFEMVVDRLFASPRYGEHMARGWLDLARYADTHGYQMDQPRTMWRWRDWVIEAFNGNMPFDQFTIEQLAGDLLPSATLQQKIATGFNRNHLITVEGGVIDEEYRTEYVVDRVTTTATTWMGLTMLCARCHDHKFDPVTMRDFYGMFALFNQVPERGINGFAPEIKTPSTQQEKELAQLAGDISTKQSAHDAFAEALAAQQVKWETTIALAKAGWEVLDPAEYKSVAGATLTKLDDKSILIGGKRAEHDRYEILARTALTNISAVRLEALTHPSLPNTGPGRYDNANFVLSEFEVDAVSVADPKQSVKVKFSSAQADYSQKNYEIARAIDGKPGTGWAVDGPVRNKDCVALFYPDKPLGFAGGTELRFTLRHDAISSHGIGRPRLSVTTSADPQSAELAGIAALPREKRTAQQSARLRDHFLATQSTPEVKKLAVELATMRERQKQIGAAIPSTMIMQDMPQRRETHMLIRGQYDKKSDRVEAALPAMFKTAVAAGGGATTRLDLARWLVAPEHPLTARVAVNRIWEHHFGTGFVRTSENFGVQGDPPSHPELLDWLALEFIKPSSPGAKSWDMQHIHRLIALSATYRQSSRAALPLLAQDPDNLLLARGPRLRFSAETVRDSALFISGLLAERHGGPSVFPYQPEGLWFDLNDRVGYRTDYVQSHGPDLYRRGLYTFWKRTSPPPAMGLFDAPEREFCVVRRSRTTTPLQALALLNDPTFVEAARHLAERILMYGGTATADRVVFAFRSATARFPSAKEAAVLSSMLERQMATYAKDPAAAAQALKAGESPRNEKLDVTAHAAWTAVARVLLNLDETITKE